MAHAQKPDFVFRRNGRIHLNRQWRQFSRLLTAEGCASAVVMLVTPCSEVVWRVLATHAIRQFPLHFPSRVSPCAITFQLDSTHFSITSVSGRSYLTSLLLFLELPSSRKFTQLILWRQLPGLSCDHPDNWTFLRPSILEAVAQSHRWYIYPSICLLTPYTVYRFSQRCFYSLNFFSGTLSSVDW